MFYVDLRKMTPADINTVFSVTPSQLQTMKGLATSFTVHGATYTGTIHSIATDPHQVNAYHIVLTKLAPAAHQLSFPIDWEDTEETPERPRTIQCDCDFSQGRWQCICGAYQQEKEKALCPTCKQKRPL